MTWQSYLDDHSAQYVDELLEFVAIPSVSAKDDHAHEVRRAGQWVMDRLAKAGLENIQMLETGGHPVVYADWLHAGAEKPTVMIYGHFDVQPGSRSSCGRARRSSRRCATAACSDAARRMTRVGCWCRSCRWRRC